MHKNFLISHVLSIIFLIILSSEVHAGENISKQFQAKSYPGSRDRDYIIHLPDGYDGSKPIPLVMVLHGCNQTNLTIQHDTNFDTIADREGFAVVYPFITSYQGLRNTNCWGFWFDEEIHEGQGEVEDLGALIREIQTDYTIDANRIHVTGLSSGAAMAIDMMVAHSEIIASGSETAGLPYSETAASVGFSCSSPGSFKPVTSVVAAMNSEMSDALRPVPLFIVHSRDDCTVNIKAGENVRDSWGKLFDIDTQNPVEFKSGTTLGTPWTHEKFLDNEGHSIVETLFISGKNHGWYGGRDGQYAFKNGPNTAQLMWDFFKAHPMHHNQPPELIITKVTTHDDRCITVAGSANDKDGSIVAVNVAFEGLYPQPPQPADLAGNHFTYTACQLRNNASYTPVVQVLDNRGEIAAVRGQPVVLGELPAASPPVLTISGVKIEGTCVSLNGDATDDGTVRSVEVKLGDQGWLPAVLEGMHWNYEVCNLPPGSYRTRVRATDDQALVTTVSGEEVVVEAVFEAVESTNLTDHVVSQRIRIYAHGFGAADQHYLDLFNQHGVSQKFPLYSYQGDWYADVENIPLTSGLRRAISQAQISNQDHCITFNSPHLRNNLFVEVNFGGDFWQPALMDDDTLHAEQCGLTDGLNSLALRASDDAGLISSISAPTQRIGANQPPELRVLEYQLIGDCMVVSGTTSDDAEVKQVAISLDNDFMEDAALNGDHWYFDQCGLTHQPGRIRVQAIDGWGLYSERVLR